MENQNRLSVSDIDEDGDDKTYTFNIEVGNIVNITFALEDTDLSNTVVAKAYPHPVILEQVSNGKMTRRLHIIGDMWTSVVLDTGGSYQFRVSNPHLDKEASTLQLRSFSHPQNVFGSLPFADTEARTSEVVVEPMGANLIYRSDDKDFLAPKLDTMTVKICMDRSIHIRLQLMDRKKLFSSFDKITINFSLHGYLFFSYVMSVGEKLELVVHEAENTSTKKILFSQFETLNDLPFVTYYNPWPLGSKLLSYEREGIYRLR